MQYEVYLDVLFLENMMIDFLILFTVRKVFPCTATYGSLLAGSFTGSALTCIILFLPLPIPIRYLLLFILVNSCMVIIGLKTYRLRIFFKYWILVYLTSFLFGGIMSWIRFYIKDMLRTGSLLFVLTICSYFLLNKGLLFLKELIKFQTCCCHATLILNGKEFPLRAFSDSGNHLSDSLTGKPVHILSQTACRRIQSQTAIQIVRYIPYQTIQRENGVLPVIRADRLIIHSTPEYSVQSPLIGISDQNDFGNGKYELILHPKDC